MTDLEAGGSLAPVVAEFEPVVASTPLRRAAARLRAVLPPGWRVEIVDAPNPRLRDQEAVLRVLMP